MLIVVKIKDKKEISFDEEFHSFEEDGKFLIINDRDNKKIARISLNTLEYYIPGIPKNE